MLEANKAVLGKLVPDPATRRQYNAHDSALRYC